MERKLKESQVTSILEDPFASPTQAELVTIEIDSVCCTVLDLLYDMWNPMHSATHNLRSIIGFLSKYMISQRKINPDTRRMREGRDMKLVLMDLYCLWRKKGVQMSSPSCSKEDLYEFVGNFSTQRVDTLLTSPTLTEETFSEWLYDYRQYLKSLFIKTVDVSMQTTLDNDDAASRSDDIEVEGEEIGTSGLDALFDASNFQKEEDSDRFPQFITKSDNGRLFTLKSPGEIDSQLIRVYVYDVKDIVRKDKRLWWKYAKLRTQFLSSSSRSDRKQLLLRRLLDQAANELSKVPGVKKESMDLDGAM